MTYTIFARKGITFRSLSMLGAFLCLFIMFSTHWDYAIIAILLCAGIYKYVEYKG